MNSAMHTYTVNQGGEFNPLSASPFSFQAYLSNKTKLVLVNIQSAPASHPR